MLSLYPANLLNSSISSNSFLVESLGFSIYKIKSPASKNNFTSSFLILISFIYFTCLTALVRTSSTILHRSSDTSVHPCVFLDFRGKLLNFRHSI